MRIATLANAAVVHTRRWVEHFRARGHDVRLFTLETPAGGLAATSLAGAPLPGVLRYPLAVPELVRELAAFAPELIDAHYVPNYGVMGVLAVLRMRPDRRPPVSVAAWGSDLLLAASSGPLQRLRARFVLTRSALVLCDAENLAAAARAAGAPPQRVRVLPWGVDRGLFQPAAAREVGLVLSTRMHEPIYDLPTVIEACARVFSEHPHATLALAGAGSLTGALERLAARRLPRERFRFLGTLSPPELAGWLARAEVYVSAARSDSTSQSLLEAMAAGAMPVVSDIAGNREWVLEGEGARLFPPGDAAALARAMSATLADAAGREAARQRNAAVIAARGDWDGNLARIEALFDRLATGRELPEGNAP